MIDLTEYTLNTGTETDIDVVDIARAAYRALPNVADWTTNNYGHAVLTHEDGETLTLDLVTLEGKITDWSITLEDKDGDIYDQYGAPVKTIDDLAETANSITSWAE